MSKLKNNKSFKKYIESLPELKKLLPETRLPVIFDTQWDIKYGYQVIQNSCGILNNPDFYRELAKYGFDVKELKERLGIKN